MQGYVKWMEGLPKWAQIVLALPFLVITWAIYRLARSINAKNTLGIIVAILLIIFGGFFLWVIDIITIIIKGKVLWFD